MGARGRADVDAAAGGLRRVVGLKLLLRGTRARVSRACVRPRRSSKKPETPSVRRRRTTCSPPVDRGACCTLTYPIPARHGAARRLIPPIGAGRRSREAGRTRGERCPMAPAARRAALLAVAALAATRATEVRPRRASHDTRSSAPDWVALAGPAAACAAPPPPTPRPPTGAPAPPPPLRRRPPLTRHPRPAFPPSTLSFLPSSAPPRAARRRRMSRR
jgi:hypothetical protein